MASSFLKFARSSTAFFTVLLFAFAHLSAESQEPIRESAEAPPPGSLFGALQQTSGLTTIEVNEKILREEYKHPAIGFAPKKLRYIVQDKTGAVIGQLLVSIEPLVENGRYIISLKKSYEFEPKIVLEHTLKADDFSPMRTNVLLPELSSEEGADEGVGLGIDEGKTGEDRSSSTQTLSSATYYYDTVTVRKRDLGSETFFSFRRLLPSYDINALDFIIHALDLKAIPPKSILILVSPFDGATHIALLEKVEKQVVYSAEARKCVTDLIRISSELFTEEYYVEAVPPHLVIKFTAGEFKFTLYEEETEEHFK